MTNSIQAEQRRRVRGCGAQRLHFRHAGIHEQAQFVVQGCAGRNEHVARIAARKHQGPLAHRPP
jgi:hypothetical protein